MEKNPELSLAPEPEQSQDCMDSSSQGILDEPLFHNYRRCGDQCSVTNHGVGS